MLSDQKLEANRQNAQKSTGPKTLQGKARSSRNALKHGLTAEHVVLSNEDENAFNELRDHWVNHSPTTDPIELALIEQGVRNVWKLRRVSRCEHANLAKRVRHAVQDFDDAEYLKVADLGRRLTDDPINRCYPMTLDPHTVKALDAWLVDDDPVKLTQQLRSSLSGVEWMLNQWHELDGLLEREGYWHYNDKFKAIRLMGRRPHDVLDEFPIAMLFVLCRAAHPEPWPLADDIQQARLGVPGKTVYEGRIEYLECFRYTEPGEPLVELRKLVKQQMDTLCALRERFLLPMNERDRAEAMDRAMFDDTNFGTLLRRYETACERELHRSITGLTKLRKERDSRGEPECDNLTTCTEPEGSSEEVEFAPAPRASHPLRNEPTPLPRSNPSNPQTQPFPTREMPPNDIG